MQQKEKRPPKCNALQKRSNWLPASPLSIEYKGRFMAVAGKGQISRKGGGKKSVMRNYYRSSVTENDSG
jgi:hypothetical protein